MPRQKSLERFLNGLLAMEQDITDQRRRSLKIVRGGSKILSAVPQPLPRLVGARLTLHIACGPPARL